MQHSRGPRPLPGGVNWHNDPIRLASTDTRTCNSIVSSCSSISGIPSLRSVHQQHCSSVSKPSPETQKATPTERMRALIG